MSQQADTDAGNVVTLTASQRRRRRATGGLPPEPEAFANEQDGQEQEQRKRGRGRPRKAPADNPDALSTEEKIERIQAVLDGIPDDDKPFRDRLTAQIHELRMSGRDLGDLYEIALKETRKAQEYAEFRHRIFRLENNGDVKYWKSARNSSFDSASRGSDVPLYSITAFEESMNESVHDMPAVIDPVTFEVTRWQKCTRASLIRSAPNLTIYDGLAFHPGVERKPDDVNFNLWTGWGCKPYDGEDYEDKCKYTLRHIREVLCNNDPIMADYYLSWLAHMFQKPDEITDKALIFHSEQGTGKTLFADYVLAKIIGKNHYLSSSDPNTFTGDFQDQLVAKLLCVAEEALWHGDLKAANRFKGMIGGSVLSLNLKGKAAIQLDNRMRFQFFSQSETVINIEASNRRFVVFRVNNQYAQNKPGSAEYFAPLMAEIMPPADKPDLIPVAVRAFYRYILNYEINKELISKVPQNTAQVEDTISTLPIEQAFILSVLTDGVFRPRSLLKHTLADAQQWNNEGGIIFKDVIYQAFLEYKKDAGNTKRVEKNEFGKTFVKMLEGAVLNRSSKAQILSPDTELLGQGRANCYVMAGLPLAREEFVKNCLPAGAKVWDVEEWGIKPPVSAPVSASDVPPGGEWHGNNADDVPF